MLSDESERFAYFYNLDRRGSTRTLLSASIQTEGHSRRFKSSEAADIMKSEYNSIPFQTNILVDAQGKPKLTDFGLAKVVDSQASTVAASSFNGKGTMRWQAPELLSSCHLGEGCGGLTPYSDVYAFACVCLEVCQAHDQSHLN